ncbi:hypothetical protein PATSB16_34480 [Pandoraea thiooxydans]|nr:hypothetical protein PATSB16_34480 [Pandoraea thiooxydans]
MVRNLLPMPVLPVENSGQGSGWIARPGSVSYPARHDNNLRPSIVFAKYVISVNF